MYCRVVHVKALSELQMKMITAYMKTTMLPRNLRAGQSHERFFPKVRLSIYGFKV